MVQSIDTKMDEIDKSILNILQSNAKITNVALAQQINLSTASTLERVKKLEQYGIITNYYAQIDYAKVGYGIELVIGVTFQKVTAAYTKLFKTAIAKIDPILTCYQVMGDMDFILIVVVKDMASYQDSVVEKLYMLEMVDSIKTLSVIQLLKHKPMHL